MKLQIIRAGQSRITGYNVVEAQPNQLNLNDVIDNSCEFILASDLVDSFSVVALGDLCNAVVRKLRIGGEIVLGGTDVRFFAKHIVNGLLSPHEACRILDNIHSMSTSEMVKQFLEQIGLNIVSIHMDGLHYEVKAIRNAL